MRRVVEALVVGTFGRCIALAARLGHRASTAQQLARCTRLGEGVEGGRDLVIENAGTIALAQAVRLSDRVRLSTYPGGSIHVGARSFLGTDVCIAAVTGTVTIGEDCLIAEQVSIRASNHGMRAGTPMRLQPNEVRDITIGNDVWIGKGVTITAGSVVASGCVIGANSVVRGETEPNTIYAGVPIQKIRGRT